MLQRTVALVVPRLNILSGSHRLISITIYLTNYTIWWARRRLASVQTDDLPAVPGLTYHYFDAPIAVARDVTTASTCSMPTVTQTLLQ